MLWIDTRSIETQKGVIAHLERCVQESEREYERLKSSIATMRPKATFYLDMQCRCLDNPTVMEAWQAFIMLTKFTLDENVRGVTTR